MITDFLKNVKNINAYHIHSQELLTLYMNLNRLVLEMVILDATEKRSEREMIRIGLKRMEIELAQFDLLELIKKIESF